MKLTEKEFETLIEALEQLPNKSQDGKLATRLMAHMLLNGSEEDMKKMEEEFAIQELKEEADRRTTKKQCGIIAGKLYMMKDVIVEEKP